MTDGYQIVYEGRDSCMSVALSVAHIAHMTRAYVMTRANVMTRAFDYHSVMTRQYLSHSHHYHTSFTHDSVTWLANTSLSLAHVTHMTRTYVMSVGLMCERRWRNDRDEAYKVICSSHDCCDHTKDSQADFSRIESGVCGAQTLHTRPSCMCVLSACDTHT